MNLITLENIYKAYGPKKILDGINLNINEGDKIGLIGLNGSGKTTLLKIIALLDDVDEGEVKYNGDINIEYFRQNMKFDNELTVLEQVFKGDSKNISLVREYEEEIIKANPNAEKILSLTEAMDRSNAWELESEAKAVLTKLGIEDFDKKIKELSGGQKRRVGLASSLINPCDLLILDEPTNHIDDLTIEWLEDYLNERQGTLLMITHDRYFLDKVTDKIVELDQGKLYSYDGNYNYYLQKKLEREQVILAVERKRYSLYRQELDWIKRGVRARGTKQKARLERFNQLKDSKYIEEEANLDISITGHRLGKKVIEIDNISKTYGSKKLINNFSYTVLRDDRIGIVGKNGCGKSTLLNILVSKTKADSGLVDIGETVNIGYFSQELDHMDPDKRVIEYIEESAYWIEASDGQHISAAKMLERFLFSKEKQWTYISELSGGEKRRLSLLKVLIQGPNVLLLDEPTNDLDTKTLAVLEEYIQEFNGPVIIVSHDRYLLDKVTDKTFAFKEDGFIEQYYGNYSYFRQNSFDDKKIQQKPEKIKKTHGSKNRSLKLSYKEKREWDTIDEDIMNIENMIEQLNIDLEKYASDYKKLEEIMEEKTNLEAKLDKKLERWIYLSELVEEINSLS